MAETQDLISFRIALRQLEGVMPAEDRRRESRYTPTGPLSRARVQIGSTPELLDADVVDLSPSGMRLAMGPGVSCSEGDRCQITIELNPAQSLHLNGEIRWVKQHPYITVFGVLLEPDQSPLQAV